MTSLAAHLFSQAALTCQTPSEILAEVNREFLRVIGGSTFMTACCAIVGEDGEVAFASAGHPPILIVRAGGEVESHWPEKTILGLKQSLSLGDSHATLKGGDIVLMYTDGLYSLRKADHQRLAHDAVEQVAREERFGEAIVDELLARLRKCSDGTPVDDDLAVIALRRTK